MKYVCLWYYALGTEVWGVVNFQFLFYIFAIICSPNNWQFSFISFICHSWQISLLYVTVVTVTRLSEIKINNNIDRNHQVLPIFQFIYLKIILMKCLKQLMSAHTFQLGKNTEKELSKGSNDNRDFQVLEINWIL